MPRFGKPYYPPKYAKWKDAACKLIQQYRAKPIEGPVSVFVEFYTAIPKSYTKKQRSDALDGLKWTRDDLDNLQKSIFDAMTSAGVWLDDSQIVEVRAIKRYALADAITVKVVPQQ